MVSFHVSLFCALIILFSYLTLFIRMLLLFSCKIFYIQFLAAVTPWTFSLLGNSNLFKFVLLKKGKLDENSNVSFRPISSNFSRPRINYTKPVLFGKFTF